LHRVLGEIVAAEHTMRNGVHETAVFAIERANRIRFALLERSKPGRVHGAKGTADAPARHRCRAGASELFKGCK
jgi:hypothetical protein